jgi:hypothetical protein
MRTIIVGTMEVKFASLPPATQFDWPLIRGANGIIRAAPFWTWFIENPCPARSIAIKRKNIPISRCLAPELHSSPSLTNAAMH